MTVGYADGTAANQDFGPIRQGDDAYVDIEMQDADTKLPIAVTGNYVEAIFVL